MPQGAGPPETPQGGRVTRGAAGASAQPMHGESELPKLAPGDTFVTKSAGIAYSPGRARRCAARSSRLPKHSTRQAQDAGGQVHYVCVR
jgi:hypothetical protein